MAKNSRLERIYWCSTSAITCQAFRHDSQPPTDMPDLPRLTISYRHAWPAKTHNLLQACIDSNCALQSHTFRCCQSFQFVTHKVENTSVIMCTNAGGYQNKILICSVYMSEFSMCDPQSWTYISELPELSIFSPSHLSPPSPRVG